MGSFASPPDATYGFIGLGNMGFGMAKNVRQKIPASSPLVVCELNKSARDEFCSTIDGKIETAENPKEIAEKCVCMYLAAVARVEELWALISTRMSADRVSRISSYRHYRTHRL
jgi:3-hydroxyisobutyrate dehydrogenase-like beta-hydroxyacid dehydrogenase